MRQDMGGRRSVGMPSPMIVGDMYVGIFIYFGGNIYVKILPDLGRMRENISFLRRLICCELRNNSALEKKCVR